MHRDFCQRKSCANCAHGLSLCTAEFPVELFVKKENGASCFRFSQMALEPSIRFLTFLNNGGIYISGATRYSVGNVALELDGLELAA